LFPESKPQSSRYLVFIICCVSLLLTSISNTSVSVAYPIITSHFSSSLVISGWVLSINLIVCAIIMPLSGRLTEIFGKKLVFTGSLALFVTGSLLCALAPNIYLLIFFRLIQSLGAGSFLPTTAGIISELFPDARQRMLGLLTSTFTIGMLIGPNLGGWLVSEYSWSSVFWFNVPFGLLAFIFAIFIIPKSRFSKGEIDLTALGLFAGSLFALITGFTELNKSATWAIPAGLFALAIILITVYLRRESKSEHHILDPYFLKSKAFVASNIYNFMWGLTTIGINSFVPLFLVKVYGMSTLLSGVLLTPRSVGTIIAAFSTSFFLTKWGYRRPMIAGNILNIVTLFILGVEYMDPTILGVTINNTAWIGLIMFISGIGMGTIGPAIDNVLVDLMPERAGTITGMKGMFRQIGGATTIALTTMFLETVNDFNLGFQIVFWTICLLQIITTPVIFLMPRDPKSKN